MSKQNKFRVWSRSENKYLVEPRLALSLLNSAPFVGTIASFDGGIEWFTGLLDKNGKEIYEGDVVKWAIGDTESRWTVTFGSYIDGEGENHLGFYLLDETTGYQGGSIAAMYPIEVVGNIHENL